MIHRLGQLVIAWAIVAFTGCAPTTAQVEGECVRLGATKPEGVPIHREPSNSFTGRRFADRAIATVGEVSSDGRWFRLETDSDSGWVVERYVDGIVDCDAESSTSPLDGSTGEIQIATWNLEHFGLEKTRGFPELTFAGTPIPARTDADYRFMATIILDLDLKLLALQEIQAVDIEDPASGETEATSPALERLIVDLGRTWSYAIAKTGSAQRIAFLWDGAQIGLNWTCEPELPSPRVDGKELFFRQPFLGYFTVFADDGSELNDFVLVGLHLASGQARDANHDRAMRDVAGWLDSERSSDFCVPSGEFDVILLGDLNMNRFDDHVETFWDEFELSAWDVLADDPSYSPTRLSGNPPALENSRIDYIVVSAGSGALQGNEVTQPTGQVHAELIALAGGGLAFRQRASDHLPVTVAIGLGMDDD